MFQGKKFSKLFANPANKNSISNNTVNKIVAAANGTVWLCGKNMLDNVSLPADNDLTKISVKHLLPLLVNRGDKNDWAINDFMIDRYNNYWVATNDQGILKFKPHNESISPIENFISGTSGFSLANTTVFSFYEDNAGVIWIGTAKGYSQNIYYPGQGLMNQVSFQDRSSQTGC